MTIWLSIVESACIVVKPHKSEIGTSFHDFTLKDSNGVDVDSRSFRGKYTLIVFWASWCGPCRAENPALNALYARNRDSLQLIGISIDNDTTKWKEAIVKDGLHWTQQVIDPSAYRSELIQFYQINGIPTRFLIDKEGKIIGVDLTPREIESELRNKK
jgi:thiol-disulfide isomerase/thioredoxin